MGKSVFLQTEVDGEIISTREIPMLTKHQANIIIDILVSKKAEILNYDRDEDWADETLDAIDKFLINDWILDVDEGDSNYLDSDAHLENLE